MKLTDGQLVVAAWLGVMSLFAFLAFGYDKWLAGRRGGRVPEMTLWWFSALGGWPGGLAGILVFRHKSAKTSFQLKFAAAFVVWALLTWTLLQVTSVDWSRRDLLSSVRATTLGTAACG